MVVAGKLLGNAQSETNPGVRPVTPLLNSAMSSNTNSRSHQNDVFIVCVLSMRMLLFTSNQGFRGKTHHPPSDFAGLSSKAQ